MHEHILEFWFEETSPEQWWKVDADFDRLVGERFSDIHAQAARCELYAWRRTPRGRLAEIIVLDQFSRNLYRSDARAFANDAFALALAQEAVACGEDLALTMDQRNFLYMPYMHSESRVIHEVAAALFEARASANSHQFELRHKAIIDRFGRYPHRNTALGRVSTEEERAFLEKPGSGF